MKLRGVKKLRRSLNELWSDLKAQFTPSDLSLFHEFSPPPTGGGHQFLRALMKEIRSRGVRIENNTVSPTTRACLFNSFNFDAVRLRKKIKKNLRKVHRVDGPITLYRGREDGSDRQIWEYNHEFADRTIFQSEYSLKSHMEMGLIFNSPIVVHNTADPEFFYPPEKKVFKRNPKIRIISTSWSDNPNKGADVYAWIDQHLDFNRYEYLFVGRIRRSFNHIIHIPPIPSSELAPLLRSSDLYLTASLHEPCSNALLEALACGLPVLHIESGSHAELVKEAGLGFQRCDEIPEKLKILSEQLENFHSKIQVPTMEETADRYLEILGLK